MRRRTSTCIKTCTGLVISIFLCIQIFNSPNYTQNGDHGGRQGGDHGGRQGRMDEKTAEGSPAELGKNRRLARVDKVEPSGPGKLGADAVDVKLVMEENNTANIANANIANANNANNSNITNNSNEPKFTQNSLAGERVHGLPNVTSSREEISPEKLNISEILANIDEMNKEEALRNEDLFGPITNNTVVIVIQVHNRITYLRHLIISLSMARDIDKTLLIFSHDVWDEDINRLVRSIDFTIVMQIFYPFSLQTHPHSFPGESRRDCPRDAKKPQAERMKCLNKDWPDLYGHYREAKFTQTKHHWWWKANQVFHKLSATSNFDGTVLFLEEDHYVAEDFLHVLSLMLKDKGNADILCLGTYLKKFNYKKDSKLVEVTQWVSSKHNMGMTLNKQIWNKILKCSSQFCQYDDYNWDWSLQHVSLTCLEEKIQVMLIKGPRVFHIGECGVHHKKSDCETSKVIEKVKSILSGAAEFLFPQSLAVVKSSTRKKIKLKKGNGGWGDKRDHALCLNMTRRH